MVCLEPSRNVMNLYILYILLAVVYIFYYVISFFFIFLNFNTMGIKMSALTGALALHHCFSF